MFFLITIGLGALFGGFYGIGVVLVCWLVFAALVGMCN